MTTTRLQFSPNVAFVAALVVTVFLLMPDLAHAAGAGGQMPWDRNLQQIQQSFTGPFAYAITIIGLVAAAGMLLFAHHEASGFIKAVAFIVMVGSLLMGANAFAATMGWAGAVV